MGVTEWLKSRSDSSLQPMRKLCFLEACGVNTSIEVPLLPLIEAAGIEVSLFNQVAACLLDAPHMTNKLRIDPTNAEVSF